MARTVDITDKLSFDTNPCIIIRNTELKVKADAASVLKILDILGDGEPSIKDTVRCMDLLFDKENRAKLDGLKLKFPDYMTVIGEAMDLVAGGSTDQHGEAPDPTTT